MAKQTKRSPERERFLRDILITICEGGSNYWMQARKVERVEAPGTDEHLDYLSMEVRSIEEPVKCEAFDTTKWKRLDLDVLARGITRILGSLGEDAPKNAYGSDSWRQSAACGVRKDIFANVATGNAANEGGDIDSEIADCIAQAGLWGHIVYG